MTTAPRQAALRHVTTPEAWRGNVAGTEFGTDVTVLFFSTEEIGGGPRLHVHTYDEVFVIVEGNARFTVGETTIDAKAGDVVFGPANVPHKFANLGPGRLRTTDIHLSDRWVQTNLDNPDA
ncbi:MAG: cupin domain-containing protein [Acuticoccus sp.]